MWLEDALEDNSLLLCDLLLSFSLNFARLLEVPLSFLLASRRSLRFVGLREGLLFFFLGWLRPPELTLDLSFFGAGLSLFETRLNLASFVPYLKLVLKRLLSPELIFRIFLIKFFLVFDRLFDIVFALLRAALTTLVVFVALFLLWCFFFLL